ncbi:hypothetical protein ACN28S_37700 [Cystobacter fuscus]
MLDELEVALDELVEVAQAALSGTHGRMLQHASDDAIRTSSMLGYLPGRLAAFAGEHLQGSLLVR